MLGLEGEGLAMADTVDVMGVFNGNVLLIHGWFRISSSSILADGSILRHRPIRSWHSGETSEGGLKASLALQICSSVSKGMSPQTMS